MSKQEQDELTKQLEEMVNIYSSGAGMDSDAKKEHEWKTDLRKHKQMLLVQKKLNRLEIYAVVIASCSLIAALFQIYLAVTAA